MAAAQDCSSASFARWSLGVPFPSLPSMDDYMVWRVPRKLVATRLGRDGCILRRTMRMSRVKTRPEARPTCTDSHAAQKGGLTFRCIALSPARSCLGGGGGKPQSLKPAPPLYAWRCCWCCWSCGGACDDGRLRIPLRPPPPLCGAITLAAEEEEEGNDGIQGMGGGRWVSW